MLVAGPPGAGTSRLAARLGEITGGNALWLREAVMAARASGALQPVGGVWRLSGDPPAASGPEELIGARVGALPGPVAEVLEYAAFGEPVGARTLAVLCSEAAGRELITVAAEGRREIVRPAHPLHGESTRDRCPEERRSGRYVRAAARLGRPAAALPRLAELAGIQDGSRVRLAARHARALAEADLAALLATAAGFDGVGLRLFAAEVRVQARASSGGRPLRWRPHPL
ncbi:hypothetical protein GCM10022419_043360 [Nonomuraea rosea]|uniref:Adenylate kinase n=1 Tax=Nonomuraea rosea TaxID=638574 RepID=A0ABP6WX28_9ACTN